MSNFITLLFSFILFILSGMYGIHLEREKNTRSIICPYEDKLIQVESDGNEVLCIYTKEPMKHQRSKYVEGQIRDGHSLGLHYKESK